MDGDGIENALDPEPLKKNSTKFNKNIFPHHLLSSNKSVQQWQNALWEEFGIAAIEHTDDHSAYVLREFYFLLHKLFPVGRPRWLSKIKYIYAFKKHDDKNDIAAYHSSLHAISIGGSHSYSHKLNKEERIRLISTIAHELGHAFLLETFSPSEFQAFCESSGWKEVFDGRKMNSLFDEPFFREHPGWRSTKEAHLHNFVSEYSYTNAHEWFAEALSNLKIKQV